MLSFDPSTLKLLWGCACSPESRSTEDKDPTEPLVIPIGLNECPGDWMGKAEKANGVTLHPDHAAALNRREE
jgi:hypothetical protein